MNQTGGRGGMTVITQLNGGRASWLLQRSVQCGRELVSCLLFVNSNIYCLLPVRKHPLDVNSQVPVLKDYWMCRVLFLIHLLQTIQISTLKVNLNLTSADVLSDEQLYK